MLLAGSDTRMKIAMRILPPLHYSLTRSYLRGRSVLRTMFVILALLRLMRENRANVL